MNTPGPWTMQPEYQTAINAGAKHIAMVNFFKTGNKETDVSGEEHEANARLIAAAPEMLEALEECREAFRDNLSKFAYKNEPIMYAAFLKIEAVIAKAKKEPPCTA